MAERAAEGEELRERRERLRARLAAAGVDMAVFGPGDDMTYLLGGHPHPDERACLLVLTPDDERLLVPSVNAEQVRALGGPPLTVWRDDEGAAAGLERLHDPARRDEVRSLALEPALRADAALLLAAAYPNARLHTVPAALGDLRSRKTEAEQTALRASAALADEAVRAAFAHARPGMTERELSEVALEVYQNAGAQSAFAMVASGANSAYPHHHTGSSVLEAGMPLMIDTGARLGGYFSDITRMAFLGAPSEDYLRVHATVERAVAAALESVRVGARAADVDRAARVVIEAAGYGERFVHRTGHGVGLSVHEAPYLTGTSQTVLEPGMAFTVEPGIYLPGRFGVRLEEVVLLSEDGPAITSALSRELFRCRS